MNEPLLENESKRLETLYSYNVLDTPEEESYDSIVRLASYICETPCALLSFIDRDRIWFKARIGFEDTEIPRETSFCTHTAMAPLMQLLVPDAALDERFKNSAYVQEGKIRFYMAIPIVSEDGFVLGTLSVMDQIPRELTVEQNQCLKDLANQVTMHLNLNKKISDLNHPKNQSHNVFSCKSQFWTMMSHKVRTSINGVMGMTELLLETKLEPIQKEYALVSMTAAENLLHVLDNVLDLENYVTGNLDLKPLPFDLKACCQEILDSFKQKCKQKDLKLIFEYDEKIPFLLSLDPFRMRQIIINLMDNAVNFTKGGSVSLKVESIQDGDKNGIKLLVEDTGVGISADSKEIIFEEFTKINEIESGQFEGPGLGLSICKNLVSLMGGEIGVESILGKGSTFSVLLYPEEAKDRRLMPRKVDYNVGNKSVLLFEEDKEESFYLQEILKGLNCRCELAQNSLQVLGKVTKHDYDLILLNTKGKEINEAEVTQRLRSLEKQMKRKNTPIIGLEDNLKIAVGQRDNNNGFNDCFSIKTKKDKIEEKLIYWLKKKV